MPRIPIDIAYSGTEGDLGLPLVEPESSLVDVAQASLAEGILSGETSSIYRSIKLAMTSREDDVTDHHELNKMFPQIDVPFNEPTSMAKAQEIARRSDDRRLLQETIQNGGDSTFVKAVSFGANLIPQALDPVGLAAGMAVGAGLTKVMGFLGEGTKLATTITKPGIAREIVEGVAGNVLTELAVVQPTTRMERQDIDTYESLTNAAAAGIVFPAVIGAGKGLFSALKRGINAPDKMAKGAALAEAQMQTGKRVEVTDYATASAKNELPDLKEELANQGDNADPELKAHIEEVESMPDVDRAAVAEKANSKQAELYHDPEVEARYDETLRSLEEPDVHKMIRDSFEETNLELKQLESEGNFSEAELEDLKLLRQDFANIDKVDEMFKAAVHCMRGN